MKCPGCNFIFFRSAKKCPSCGGGLSRAAFAEQPDEEFTIYAGAAGGLGLGVADSFDTGEDMTGSLYDEPDTFAGEDQDNFNLDLSDLDAPVNASPEVAPEPEVPVEDTLNFDLGSGEFSDVDVDGMGIDLEVPGEEPSLDLDLGDDLNLDSQPEPELDLDLGDDLSLDPEPEPEPELDLDLGGDDADPEPEISLDDSSGIELDLGGDESEDDGLSLDLDLDSDPTPEEMPASAPEPDLDSGLDLELDGLELDLDLDSDDDK